MAEAVGLRQASVLCTPLSQPRGHFPSSEASRGVQLSGGGLRPGPFHWAQPWALEGRESRPQAEPRGKSPAQHMPCLGGSRLAWDKGGQLAAHEPAPSSEIVIGRQTRTGGKGSSPGQGPQSCRDTNNLEQTVIAEAPGWRECRRREHGRMHAAEHLSWRPGRWRVGWRGSRSQATWGQGGGRPRAAGRGTAAARARLQLKARWQRESPSLAGPQSPGACPAKAAGRAQGQAPPAFAAGPAGPP